MRPLLSACPSRHLGLSRTLGRRGPLLFMGTPLVLVTPHIFLLEGGAPAGGADGVLALLEGGKIAFDAAAPPLGRRIVDAVAAKRII